MTSCLTGFNGTNQMNLTGKILDTNPFSNKIKTIKTHILTNFILPLYSEQWDILNKNKYLIDQNITQLEKYLKMYKTNDLLSFVELLKILKIVIDKNETLFGLESKKQTMDKNGVINMVYRTTKIRLKPEYEIYHIILGKPDMKLKEKYMEEVLIDIRNLMSKERITFEQIQQYINNKYSAFMLIHS